MSMNLLADTESLRDALSVAASVSPQKSPNAAILNVLLVADDSGVQLRATDLERSVRVHVEGVQVKDAGVALIPGKQVVALLKETSTPTVSLTLEGDQIVVTAGTGRFAFSTWPADDFPAITFPDAAPDVSLSGDVFTGMVERTVFAAAREETRYAINGVLIRLEANRVTMVGTDGRRLALNTTYVADAYDEPIQGIIPVPGLQAAAKAVKAAHDSQVDILLTGDKAVFRVNGYELACQLLDNRFPEYGAVVPGGEGAVTLDSKPLMAAVRQVAVLSGDDVRAITLEFRRDELEIRSGSSRGAARQTITLDSELSATIAFNPDYLLDALKLADEEIKVALADDQSPARFDLGEGSTYVLMPISAS